MSAQPPRIARAVLRRVLAPKHRPFILDDLSEDYRRRLQGGDRPADVAAWYWRELARSIGPSLRHRAAISRQYPSNLDASSAMESTLAALLQATRRLVKAPGFSLAAVVTLGLGIGANSAIFSLVHGVLIQPLPYEAPDRLVALEHSAPGLDLPVIGLSYGTYLHYMEHTQTLENAAFIVETSANLSGEGEPERINVVTTIPPLLNTLGIRPLLGRDFSEADNATPEPNTVILSHGFWQRRYGGDAEIVGRTLRINSRPREVIGVLPRGVNFPSPGVDLYTTTNPSPDDIRFGGLFRPGVGRMRPGVTPAQVKAELDGLIPALSEVYGVPPEMIESSGLTLLVEPLKDHFLGGIGRALWVLLGSVAVLLTIACANVANLFLVRSESRHREVAVRLALGASRVQMARYFLSEALLLAGAGCLLGLAIAYAGVGAVVASEAGIPRLHEVRVSGEVIAFTALLAGLAGVALGCLPIVRYGRSDLASTLKDDARSSTASRQQHRGRNLLVAAQVALALTLLVGSALMVQSFWRLRDVDLGFRPGGVLTAQIVAPPNDYVASDDVVRLLNTIIERVEAIPGVQRAGAVSALPLTPGVRFDPLYVEGSELDPNVLPPVVTFKHTTAGYFDVMGIPLLDGTVVDRYNYDAAASSVMVNAALADQMWPQESALQKRAGQDLSRGPAFNAVAGVVGSVRDRDIADDPTPIFYYPMLEGAIDDDTFSYTFSLVVRTNGDPLAIAGSIREAVAAVDANLPIANIRTLESLVASASVRTSFTMTLLIIAAGVALFLGTIGLYGVISYTVSQRSREIGLRMALGARAADVRQMVLGAVVTLAGVLMGLLAAFAVTRALDSLLYEINAGDPVTFVAMALLLLCVALAATYLPARRAAAVDPAIGLRSGQ